MKLASRFGWTPAMAVSAFMLALVSPAVAEGITELEQATLAGLTGVGVIVLEMGPDAEIGGLAKSTLRTDVELRLRQAGIRVLGENEALAAPGSPYLYLHVNTAKPQGGDIYAISIYLGLAQGVRLTRNPAIASMGTTWRARGTIGTAPANRLHQVRDAVRDNVDEFINAYLAANPKK